MNRAALMTLFLACAPMACVEASPRNENTKRLAQYILDAPPPDVPHRTDLVFGGRVRLIGYRIDPDTPVVPGRDVKVTMIWQALDRVGRGWTLTTQLLDDKGNRLGGDVEGGPLRDVKDGKPALPPGDWQRGKVYLDEQTFQLPADATSFVRVMVGVRRGEERMPVTVGVGDGEARGLVVRIRTTRTKVRSPTEPPELRAYKLDADVKPPKIDGKLDDEAWRGAATTGPFIDVSTGGPARNSPVNGSAKVLWDDTYLYLGFEVTDEKLIGGFKPGEKDPHLWQKECVEIMVDPDGDGDNKDYYEIQISPQNLIFDSQFDDYNAPRGGPDGPFGHQEWSIGGLTAVVVDGTLDKDDDKDRGYTVEAAIPWKSFGKAKSAPPQPDDSWRMNFYAMRENGGVAWSPILSQGNFHKAARFGRVTWAVGPGTATASASASASASVRPRHRD